MEAYVPAMDIVPAHVLEALMGIGLKLAYNWSLRASQRRTTLLLVWDQEDIQEGNLKCMGTRRKRVRRPRETPPDHSTPPPRVSEEPAPVPTCEGRHYTGGCSKGPHGQDRSSIYAVSDHFHYSDDDGSGYVAHSST